MSPLKNGWKVVDHAEDSEGEYGSDDSEADRGMKGIDDMLQWLGLPCTRLLPVIGSKHMQIVHSIWLICLAVCISMNWQFVMQDIHAPGPLNYLKYTIGATIGGLWGLYPLGVLARLWMSRNLLHSTDMSSMVARVNSLQPVDQWNGQHRREEIHQRKCQYLEVARGRLRCSLLIMGIVMPGTLATLLGLAAYSQHRKMGARDELLKIYFGFALPWILAMTHGAFATLVQTLTVRFCGLCVEHFFVHVDELFIPPKGYWLAKAEEYQELDRLMTRLLAKSSNVMLVQIGFFAAMGWISVVCACEVEDVMMTTALCLAAGMFGGIILYALYPLARISSLANSKYSQEPSMVIQAMMLGVKPMGDDVRLEYLTFLEMTKTLPLGAKLPFFGLMTMEDLTGYAKVLAASVPVAWTFMMSFLHGGQDSAGLRGSHKHL